ncbi:unnamed protein product, partial [Pleuronectes platessa]
MVKSNCKYQSDPDCGPELLIQNLVQIVKVTTQILKLQLQGKSRRKEKGPAVTERQVMSAERLEGADMEDDSRPLLSSGQAGESYSHRGSTDSLDFKAKRPFHVEPRNIVDEDPQERVSAEAAILNSRVHYYGRLTGSSDRLLSPPNHVVPRTEEIYVYSPLGTAFKVTSSDYSSKNPSIITIFAIWNTMMGTSILSIPWGIKQAGFTLGVLILVSLGLLMLYCCYIVLKSPKSIPYIDTSDWEFPDVCHYYFGKFGQWSSLVFSMVSLIGAMVVYWVLMSNFLYNTGQFIYS